MNLYFLIVIAYKFVVYGLAIRLTLLITYSSDVYLEIIFHSLITTLTLESFIYLLSRSTMRTCLTYSLQHLLWNNSFTFYGIYSVYQIAYYYFDSENSKFSGLEYISSFYILRACWLHQLSCSSQYIQHELLDKHTTFRMLTVCVSINNTSTPS